MKEELVGFGLTPETAVHDPVPPVLAALREKYGGDMSEGTVTYEVTLRARGRFSPDRKGRVEAEVTVPVTVPDQGHGGDNRAAAIKAARPLLEGVILPALREAAAGELRWELTGMLL